MYSAPTPSSFTTAATPPTTAAPTAGAPTAGAPKTTWKDWTKALAPGVGGLFQNLFGGATPQADYSQAQGYLSQIPDILKQYMSPYTGAGAGALSYLTPQYAQLLKDPGAVMSRIGAGYTESPGYQFQKSEAERAIGQASAAGGMAGSPMQQQQAGTMASQLASQDYGDYMKRAMGLYGHGISGFEGLERGGQQAATGMGEDLSSVLMSQAGLSKAQADEIAQQAQQKQSGFWGDIGSVIGGAASIL